MRYIELNPVRAGMVDHPGAYRWSSYRCNAQGEADELIRPHAVFTALDADPGFVASVTAGSFGTPWSPATWGGSARGPTTAPRSATTALPSGLRVCSAAEKLGSVPYFSLIIRALREFWEKHPRAETPLRGWYAEASRANWRTPSDIKAVHRSAGFLANDRVVFNIKGNDYRLVVAVRYPSTTMFIRFVGTHPEYDQVDAENIQENACHGTEAHPHRCRARRSTG